MKINELSSRVPDCHSFETQISIDCWPLINARKWFYGLPSSFSVDYESGTPTRLRYASVATLSSSVHRQAISQSLKTFFGPRSPSTGTLELQGSVQHIFKVHHDDRHHETRLQTTPEYEVHDLDKEIERCMGFSIYSTTEQQQKVTTGTDLYKPGDTVVILHPISATHVSCANQPRQDEASDEPRLCIILRFWTEEEENSRRILFIQDARNIPTSPYYAEIGLERNDSRNLIIFSPILTSSPSFCLPIRSILLGKPHPGSWGPKIYESACSIGHLANNEHYFIYRCILFWDGFQTSLSRSNSEDDIYMMCLNLPPLMRTKSNAIRILTITPPKTDTIFALTKLFDNIGKGVSETFLTRDADGCELRIFINVVVVLGDNPALNAELDVLGHTATACCNLCWFQRRKETETSCRYVHLTVLANKTQYERNYFVYRVVRDCNASSDQMRILGMKTIYYISSAPLHYLSHSCNSRKEEHS